MHLEYNEQLQITLCLRKESNLASLLADGEIIFDQPVHINPKKYSPFGSYDEYKKQFVHVRMVIDHFGKYETNPYVELDRTSLTIRILEPYHLEDLNKEKLKIRVLERDYPDNWIKFKLE